MLRKLALLLPLCLSLGGCSSGYSIRAFVIDGQIAFAPTDENFWDEPECFYSIMVSTKDGPPAAPANGDDGSMVASGVYWNESFAVTSCENQFPVRYGAELKGPLFRRTNEYHVNAKPLLAGVIYQVSTASEGSAYGAGTFMISPQRKVVNLPV